MRHGEGVWCGEGDGSGLVMGLCSHEVSETSLLCTHLILVCEVREVCVGVVCVVVYV